MKGDPVVNNEKVNESGTMKGDPVMNNEKVNESGTMEGDPVGNNEKVYWSLAPWMETLWGTTKRFIGLWRRGGRPCDEQGKG